MLYYRTHASRVGELPPELVGWESPCEDATLSENIVGEHRVVGVTPPFVFAPPSEGWVKLSTGWEVASEGVFNPVHHLKLASKFLCKSREFDNKVWSFPIVLNEEGGRGFKVHYGGPDFLPQLTKEQEVAFALAQEIRANHIGKIEVGMSLRARWSARLLPLIYCLSETSISILGVLTEDIIESANAIAGGYYRGSSE